MSLGVIAGLIAVVLAVCGYSSLQKRKKSE